MSFKVTDFGTNRKLVYDFLLMNNTNLLPVMHRFKFMRIIGQIYAFDRGTSL